MAKRNEATRNEATRNEAEHEPIKAERTRTSATMVAVSIAVVFLVLLVIFIAQNNRQVPIHFLGAKGTVSEAVALIASAVAGAVLVLAVGIARVIQLRVGTRRHNKAMARQQKDAARQQKEVARQAARGDRAATAPGGAPAVPAREAGSAAPAAEGEAEPVDTKG